MRLQGDMKYRELILISNSRCPSSCLLKKDATKLEEDLKKKMLNP
jgi:hypothetical protein